MASDIKETMAAIDNLLSVLPRKTNNILANPSGSTKATSFNELLIHRVKEFPELYDQQHRACTDNGERNKIWDMIATSIDSTIPGEFAKKRWLQMRDRYRKELKLALRDNFKFPPKWCYFNHLVWLDPYLKDCYAQAGCNFPLQKTREDEKEGYSNEVLKNTTYEEDSIEIVSSSEILRNLLGGDHSFFQKTEDNNNHFLDNLTTIEHNLEFSSSSNSSRHCSESGANPDKTDDMSETLFDGNMSQGVIAPRVHRMKYVPYQIKRNMNNSAKTNISDKILSKINGNIEATEDIFVTKKDTSQEKPNQFESQMFQWMNDEDFLFSKLIATRMNGLSKTAKRDLKRKIMNLVDEKEEEQESS
uniref:MADF domain-containing protein n=1 Tax=Rhabditophanes sp. KR3021 TaxID=114890 RepID=A0AC35TTH7_9BILA